MPTTWVNRELSICHAMNELTVKIASRCLIGGEVRERVDSDFADADHELQNGINTLGFFLPRLPTPAHRSRDRARQEVAELFSEVMAERRCSGVQADDFMQTLMRARYKDGRALRDEEITGILLTVLFAGQYTSAVLATWTVLLDRFDFQIDTASPAPSYGSWVTGPREPCRLRYRRHSLTGVFRRTVS